MGAKLFIQCENLVKIYRLESALGRSAGTAEVQALQGLDLTVQHGEMIGVVGASGSGKSTLLNILGGLDRPTGGRVVVNQKDLARFSLAELDQYRREVVGFVWQQASRNLIPYLTALENVQVPLTLSGRLGTNLRKKPLELLKQVGLEDRIDHRLDELSGGEQQRVAIAIALANQPSLLLADEPTGELDTATAQTIYGLLRELNRALGLTILIVSHDTTLADRVDRVVAIRDGKLASETVRRGGGSGKGGAAREEDHHFEELLVLDSAGRLQLPREVLTQFNIHRRVRLEMTREGILIRPPEKEHLPAEGSGEEAGEPSRPEGALEWTGERSWIAGLRRSIRRLLALFQKRGAKERADRDSREDGA